MQQDKLDFAYKYPFSKEAKEVVAGLNATAIDRKYLEEGVSQVESALRAGTVARVRATGITEVKLRYIMGYVYARMLISAIGDRYSISRFAAAEADAASESLALNIDDMVKIGNEFGLGIKRDKDSFVLGFEAFVSVPKKKQELRLINQRLTGGRVTIGVRELLELVKGSIEKGVGESLPIETKALPKEIIEAAKALRPREKKIPMGASSGAYAWIERLLATPIADVRHRSVNLIFAPYLVNVRGLDVDAAAKIITDYIERCKKLNPNTKINESYIRYQCKYAKDKSLRPLSLAKARELLREVAEFE
jgi:hypothetical protein